MINVEIKYISPTKALEIVQELRDIGWVQGTDFDFAYYKAEWDNFSNDAVTPQKTVFTFYDDTSASYFTLRFS